MMRINPTPSIIMSTTHIGGANWATYKSYDKEADGNLAIT